MNESKVKGYIFKCGDDDQIRPGQYFLKQGLGYTTQRSEAHVYSEEEIKEHFCKGWTKGMPEGLTDKDFWGHKETGKWIPIYA